MLGRLLAVEVAEYPVVPVKPNGRRIDRLAGAGDHLGTTGCEGAPFGQVSQVGWLAWYALEPLSWPAERGEQLIRAVV